jgi:hypothetical protein
MSEMIDWIAASAGEGSGDEHKAARNRMISQMARDHAAHGMTEELRRTDMSAITGLPVHSFPAQREFTTEDTEGHRGSHNPHFWQQRPEVGHPSHPSHPSSERTLESQNLPQVESETQEIESSIAELSWEEERERRIYRWRTIRMLRRYMRYSIDTGRLPSVLGREFFRARVSARSAVTFEDRVIFVHDMETSLNKLDEFSREVIARYILQEHDLEATARLLHCGKRTIQRYIPMALDLLSDILLDMELIERTFPIRENSCQGGKMDEDAVSSS